MPGGCGTRPNTPVQGWVARPEPPVGLGEGGGAGARLPDGPGAQASPSSLTEVPLTVGPALLGIPHGRDLGSEAKAFSGPKGGGRPFSSFCAEESS